MDGFFLIPKKGTGGGAEAIPLIVTCSDQFAGTTITASDGTSTLTETCPSSSPYEVTFILPNDGTWTISGTASGQTYTTSFLIEPYETTLNAIPEGSTVLPTDDIQTWLFCAGIFDKAYTTISEVLNDATTVTTLIASNNAADYMARSATWASSVCADSSAMTKIGANDYCADTLLADSDWCSAICDSTYFESVLNVKVPTMTSDTQPSGEVSAATLTSNSSAYQSFNSVLTNMAVVTGTSGWIQYEFTVPVNVRLVSISEYNRPTGYTTNSFPKDLKFEVSDDGSSFVEVGTAENTTVSQGINYKHKLFNNNQKKKIFRMSMLSNHGQTSYTQCGYPLQFYGRA